MQRSFAAHYREMGITSIAFLKLSAGHGKLPWNEVGPLMALHLGAVDCKVIISIEDGDTAYLAAHSE
jgi:O-acetyl-ADP-ribose deacetylase (regulator of RNase III)